MSWDPSVAAVRAPILDVIYKVVWSPCSRFVAISLGTNSATRIQILDAVTLKQLNTFTSPQCHIQLFTFSPESHLLTSLGDKSGPLISWDLQTGVQASKIPLEESLTHSQCESITHSDCGTMVGVLFEHSGTTIVSTYDILSSSPIYHHPIERPVGDMIWTHSECLQFATFGPESLTIWEVGFASKRPPKELKSLPTPNNFSPLKEYLFLSTPTRLAFIIKETIFVWDTQQSKFLLESEDIETPHRMTFSSSGNFFACMSGTRELCLWMESITGYILHQKIPCSTGQPEIPLLSPNGQSIIMFSGATIQLWRTIDSTISQSSISTEAIELSESFILGFSPDRLLAVAARLKSNMAVVFNLESGVTCLTINTSMEIHGAGITGSTVIIVGSKVIAWNLPMGDHVLNATANIDDSVWTMTFDYPAHLKLESIESASISLSCHHIIVMGDAVGGGLGLMLYDVSTGGYLADAPLKTGWRPLWFTWDEHEVWCGRPGGHRGWAIIKDSNSTVTKLENLEPTKGPSGGFPWESPHSYKVTDDGWMYSSSGKRLFWFPPHWQAGERDRIWYGQFFGLRYCELPEVVILEVLEE